jgi:hypothetical protein
MELLEPATSELLELEVVEGLEGPLLELGSTAELLDVPPTMFELTPPPVPGSSFVGSEEQLAITQSIAETRARYIKPFLDSKADIVSSNLRYTIYNKNNDFFRIYSKFFGKNAKLIAKNAK